MLPFTMCLKSAGIMEALILHYYFLPKFFPLSLAMNSYVFLKCYLNILLTWTFTHADDAFCGYHLGQINKY